MSNNTTDEIVSAYLNTFRLFKQKLEMGHPFYQLPLAQIETLRFVEERNKVFMKDVADFLSITPPSATVLINNLVSLGYIKRHFSKNDRRTIHLTLTKKGKNILQKCIEQ